MDSEKGKELIERLVSCRKILDVGGGTDTFALASHVIDVKPMSDVFPDGKEREHLKSLESWVQMDVCSEEEWPFEDKSFDFVVCSQMLEDVRNPVRVCAEMIRVGKAGYIETPTRVFEQSKGVEHPLYAGYYYHRWLVDLEDNCLCFRLKPHSLNALKDAIVVNVGPFKWIAPEYENLQFEWTDSFAYREIIETDEQEVNRELCDYAAKWRNSPNLTVPLQRPFLSKLGRWRYFQRLKRGSR
jgi:hypothetical protein